LLLAYEIDKWVQLGPTEILDGKFMPLAPVMLLLSRHHVVFLGDQRKQSWCLQTNITVVKHAERVIVTLWLFYVPAARGSSLL